MLNFIIALSFLLAIDGKSLTDREECDLLLHRIKRDTNNFADDDEAFLNSVIKSTLSRVKQRCVERYNLQEARDIPAPSDVGNMDDLRKEVSKLKDLVSIIKDQQYILNTLETASNRKSIDKAEKNYNSNEKQSINTNDELEYIRNEMNKLQQNNQTKDVTGIVNTSSPHAQLQATIAKQQADINNMRHLLEGVLIELQTTSRAHKDHDDLKSATPDFKQINSGEQKEIVGAMQQPHTITLHQNQESKLARTASSSAARASDDLAALLEVLAPDSPTDSIDSLLKSLDADSSDAELERRLLNIEKQVKRKKKQQLQDRFKLLEKELKNGRDLDSKTTTDGLSNSDVKRLLMKLIKNKNDDQLQSKTLDDETILDELKALQKSIKNLNNDDDSSLFGDLDLEEKNGSADININKLISSGLINEGHRRRKLTPQQVKAIRRRIMAMKNGAHQSSFDIEGGDNFGEGANVEYGDEGNDYGFSGHHAFGDHEYAHLSNGFDNPNSLHNYGFHPPGGIGPYQLEVHGYGPHKYNHYSRPSYSSDNPWYGSTNQFGTPLYPNYNVNPQYLDFTADTKATYLPISAPPYPHAAPGYEVKPSTQFFQAQNSENSYHTQPSHHAAGAAQPHANQENVVSDLKNQVYELQGVINNYNRPEYIQKPEDKQTVYMLDRQIKDLQNVINNLQEPVYQSAASLQSDPNIPQKGPEYAKVPPQPISPTNYPPATESYAPSGPPMPPNMSNQEVQAVEYKPSAREYHKFRKRDVSYDARNSADALIHIASLLGNALAIEQDSDYQRQERASSDPKSFLKDLSQRVASVRKQLDIHRFSMQKHLARENSYGYGYNDYSINVPDHDKHVKKQDIFDKIFDKILDKVIDKIQLAFPKIIEAIFGKLQINNYNYKENTGYYGTAYDNEYQLEQSFHDMGLSGILPLIIVKLLSKVQYVVKYMQKFKFFRTFLVPIIILAITAGSIIFLTWWLQSGDEDNLSVRPYGASYGDSSYRSVHWQNETNPNNNNRILEKRREFQIK